MKYTESHEWIKNNSDNISEIGITDHAQKELGDIVFIELPELDRLVKRGDVAAVLESTKAAADVYAPVSGKIVEINTHLSDTPELVNQSPESEGWIFKIQLSNPGELNDLLDQETYFKMLQ